MWWATTWPQSWPDELRSSTVIPRMTPRSLMRTNGLINCARQHCPHLLL